MILLLDLGNHRLKWQLRPHAGALPVTTGGVGWDGDWPEMLATALRTSPRPQRALAACVAGSGRRAELRRFLEAQGVEDITFPMALAELAGVKSAYRHPSRLGIDRWCAAVAAYRRCRSAVLVADAGTAWTYDLVDGSGQHRGGWIAPGAETQYRSLHTATASLPCLDAETAGQAGRSVTWGRDTEEAIRNGVRAMLTGLLSVAEEAAHQSIGSGFAKVATGGDREALELLRARNYTIVEDLVLEGLALYAGGEHDAP
jgi:type III pantothenate kinase